MSTTLILIPELLIEIFKFLDEYDYRTKYSCILVNKQWHNFNIPALWRNPFYCNGSTKILFNCLLTKDKNFFRRNGIELTFELLERPTLHNYAKFTTELDFQDFLYKLEDLFDNVDNYNYVAKNLLDFILENSMAIRKIIKTGTECEWLNNHRRFNACFQNLYQLGCDLTSSAEFIKKLTNTCKNIQVLKINDTDSSDGEVDYRLTQLILSQNQIKRLLIYSYKYELNFSIHLISSILKHAHSIIHYDSRGRNNLDFILLPTLQNLKALAITVYDRTSPNKMKFLKSIFFSKIETIELAFYDQPILLDLSTFIKNNGSTLKDLKINGTPRDLEFLEELFQTIEQNCHNLEILGIFYNNRLVKQLFKLFITCTKLKTISLVNRWNEVLNGDKILSVINQTSPKNLNKLTFIDKVTVSDNSLKDLMNNWKGPKPFTIELLGTYTSSFEINELDNLLKKYKDLRFLEYKINNFQMFL